MINNKYSFVFPGQGSQTVGMLQDIAYQFGEVKQTFEEASEAINKDLWHLIQYGPAEELDKTEQTQPALLAASYAIWRIIESRCPLKPALLAGHSLGEYTALVCAKAIPFFDAIRLVAARGHYMQAAVPPGIGAMAAIIGLSANEVMVICKETVSTGEILAPANFNSLGQVVIAGHQSAVLRAVSRAKEKGAKMAILIPVSVPSHCELMYPAAIQLKELLTTFSFNEPTIPILNNVDVKFYGKVDSIQDGLVRQLYCPVHWVDIIQYFQQTGVTHIVECGPGQILTGLNKRID